MLSGLAVLRMDRPTENRKTCKEEASPVERADGPVHYQAEEAQVPILVCEGEPFSSVAPSWVCVSGAERPSMLSQKAGEKQELGFNSPTTFHTFCLKTAVQSKRKKYKNKRKDGRAPHSGTPGF